MSLGPIGRKVGMTRVFTEDGASIPVTVLEVIPNRVTQIKTVASDGYTGLQITHGERRASRVTKAQAGHFAKAGVAAGSGIHEFNVTAEVLSGYQVGGNITVELFQAGQIVDVTGTSIGMAQDPGRVFPGKRMPGHLGHVTVTTQNLEVIRVDAERNLLLIKGAIPGSKGGDVVVRPAVKVKGVK